MSPFEEGLSDVLTARMAGEASGPVSKGSQLVLCRLADALQDL